MVKTAIAFMRSFSHTHSLLKTNVKYGIIKKVCVTNHRTSYTQIPKIHYRHHKIPILNLINTVHVSTTYLTYIVILSSIYINNTKFCPPMSHSGSTFRDSHLCFGCFLFIPFVSVSNNHLKTKIILHYMRHNFVSHRQHYYIRASQVMLCRKLGK